MKKLAQGFTPLMWAAGSSSSLQMTKVLIAEGANVKARSRDGQTLLILSASNNPNPEVLRLPVVRRGERE